VSPFFLQFVPHYAEVSDDGTGRIKSVLSGGAVDVEDAEKEIVPGGKDEGKKKKQTKEEKAREKKEKAEMKRRLKEQDRQIKDEAKKKTETPSDRRRKRIREKERAAAAATRALAKKSTRCCVHLLDGTDYEFDIEVRLSICPSILHILCADILCSHDFAAVCLQIFILKLGVELKFKSISWTLCCLVGLKKGPSHHSSCTNKTQVSFLMQVVLTG